MRKEGIATEDPRVPDYYGTGRQPKSKKSYVGLAVALVVVLLAANAVPFVIPYFQQTTEERPAPTEQQELLLRRGITKQMQTEICGMEICDLDDAQCSYWGLPNGVIVGQVDEGSAASKAGVLQGDVIVRIGRKTPDSAEDCLALLSAYADGEQIPVALYRSGEILRIELTYRAE